MLGLSFLKARGSPCFYPEAQHPTFFLSGTLEPDTHSCPLPEPYCLCPPPFSLIPFWYIRLAGRAVVICWGGAGLLGPLR